MNEQIHYRVQHITRSVESNGAISLNTETEYDGTDKEVAEKLFFDTNLSDTFGFGESMVLMLFSAEDTLVRYYERTK